MKEVFRQIRYSLYLTFIILFVFFQWIATYKYKCNVENTHCFACGLRTAVDFFFQGKFLEAYLSNKLIVLIVLFSFVAITDVLFYLWQKYIKQR